MEMESNKKMRNAMMIMCSHLMDAIIVNTLVLNIAQTVLWDHASNARLVGFTMNLILFV